MDLGVMSGLALTRNLRRKGLGLIGPLGRSSGSTPVPTTTWNPADKNANIQLTNGNLTANNTATGGFYTVRAIANHSTGKFYYETHFDAMNGTLDSLLAVINGAASLSSYPTSDANGVGYNPHDGGVAINGASIGAAQASVQGDTVACAIDIAAKLIWFRVNAGNWNNNGSANPAAGTGGFSLSTLAAGPYFPAWGIIASSGAVVTANFGASSYSNPAPSGFGNW